MLTDPYSPLNPNGSEVLAHDPLTGTTYIRLPEALWRVCDCKCEICVASKSPGYWDTLAVPKKGHAWTVHMPAGRVAEFNEYIAKKVADKKAARKKKSAPKTPTFNPNKGAPWE